MANRVQIPTGNPTLIATITDEARTRWLDFCLLEWVMLTCGEGHYIIVDSKTTIKQIEDAFKAFTAREDIAVVLISQCVANMIRFLVDTYNKPVPAILEIPSK